MGDSTDLNVKALNKVFQNPTFINVQLCFSVVKSVYILTFFLIFIFPDVLLYVSVCVRVCICLPWRLQPWLCCAPLSLPGDLMDASVERTLKNTVYPRRFI